MAPIEKTDHDLVEQQIKDTIQSLFQLLVQVSTYDQAGRATQPILSAELSNLSNSLRAVHRTASSSLRPARPSSTSAPTTTSSTSAAAAAAAAPSLPDIPETLIAYVEGGRNPDVYTREMVESVRRMNQLARAKEMAFVRFRDVLAREMSTAMPEVRADVERVIEATGGEVPIAPVVREGQGADGMTAGGGGGGGDGGGVDGDMGRK